MRKHICILIAIVLFALCHLEGWAQGRVQFGSVYVKVLKKNTGLNKDEVPFVPVPNCTIYVFNNTQDAKKWYNNRSSAYSFDKESSGLSMVVESEKEPDEKFKTGQDGACMISVGMSGYIVAFKDNDFLLSKGVVPIAGRADIEIEVERKGDLEIDEVEVIESMNFKEIVVDPVTCGDRLFINATYNIPSKDTHSTYRYGILPCGREVLSGDYGFTSAYQKLTPTTGKQYKQMRPYLLDGERYHNTQHRKMGYNPEKNDPMDEYVNRTSTTRIKTREPQPVAINIHEEIQDVKTDAIYPVWGYRWYENYGSLVKSDTILVFNGFRKDPMRFLDYSFPDVKINKEYYRRDPRPDLDEGSAELRIEFVVGKADILPSDTTGLEQLEEITKTLEGIAHDHNARLYSVHIHGFSSPEGGRATNENLCRQRAGYIQRQVVSRLPGTPSDIEGSVASWLDVAKLLRKDSIADPENIARAKQIEDIVSSTKSDSQIDSKIQSLPLARFLKENENKYYKPLRKVEISYQYKQQRILSREEVIERYEKTKEVTFPYQYAYLFDYLIDRPEELGEVAAKAMKLEREPTGKPWTLAAYYLAKSYTDRNKCDTLILKPYITLNGKEFIEETPGSRLVPSNPMTLLNAKHVSLDGDTLQIANDEGIVIQQIHMLIKANKIAEASTMAKYLLPGGNPKYDTPKKMLMSKCGDYRDPEIKEVVASTSEWNRVVVYAAQDAHPNQDPTDWRLAWDKLNDSTLFKMTTARELYMKAALALRFYETAKNYKRGGVIPVQYFELGDNTVYSHPEFNNLDFPWGAFMVKACEIDPSFLDILKFDGEFGQNYRDSFAVYWNEKHPDKILK